MHQERSRIRYSDGWVNYTVVAAVYCGLEGKYKQWVYPGYGGRISAPVDRFTGIQYCTEYFEYSVQCEWGERNGFSAGYDTRDGQRVRPLWTSSRSLFVCFSPSFCLSVSLTPTFSLSVSLSHTHTHSLLPLSHTLSLHLSACLSLSHTLSPSVCLSLSLTHIHSPPPLSLSLSICLSVSVSLTSTFQSLSVPFLSFLSPFMLLSLSISLSLPLISFSLRVYQSLSTDGQDQRFDTHIKNKNVGSVLLTCPNHFTAFSEANFLLIWGRTDCSLDRGSMDTTHL